MSAVPKYVFVIVDSSGNLYEFERCTNRAWEYYENDVGRCRFFIPKNDVKLNTSSVPDGAFSEIRVYRNGSLVWQGMTQIIQDVKDGTWVYGETYLSALGWYSTRYDETHTTAAIGTIITNEYDNIETRASNFLTAKITQGTIQTPYQTSTSNNLTLTRTLYNDNFLVFLKEMVVAARGEMTAAWAQNTVFNISFSEATPTFTFTRDVGTDKSDVIFELDSEIVDFSIIRDSRDIVNDAKGFAIATGPDILTSTEADATSKTSWYRREVYPFYNNITDQGDLDQAVDNLIGDNKISRQQLNLQFATGLTPFDGYSMGDSIKIRVVRGSVSVDEFRRVVGMEVNIDPTGVEKTVPILVKQRT